MSLPAKPTYSYQVGVFLGMTIFRSVGATIEGRENIPKTGSVLLVSNHQSFLDPMFVAMGCNMRQVHYMAKEELFRVPTSRHMMDSLGAFPVDRKGPSRKTLAHVLTLLREGRCVCLFAEGTRSKDGTLQAFQPGFARIAKKTNTPVIPVALTGSRNLFENIQGMSLPIWSRIIGYPAPRLKFGPAVSPENSIDEIAQQTHETVSRLLEES